MEKLVHQHVLDTLNNVHKAEHELLRSSRKLLSSLNDVEKGHYLYIKNSLEKVMLSDGFDRHIEKNTIFFTIVKSGVKYHLVGLTTLPIKTK